MESLIIPALAAVVLFGSLAAAAFWLNRRYRLKVTPPMPPPRTAAEKAWARELDTLELERRHKYC